MRYGTEAAFSGNPNFTMVSVKKAGPRMLLETRKRDGKTVSIMRMTVSRDGKTMRVSSHNTLDGHTTTYTNQKI